MGYCANCQRSWITPDSYHGAEALAANTVVNITGESPVAPEISLNPKLPTGEVEIYADEIELLNAVRNSYRFRWRRRIPKRAGRLAAEISLFGLARRWHESQFAGLRHQVVKAMRRHLEDVGGFIEVETPILTRSTPEGARDYLIAAASIWASGLLSRNRRSCSNNC